MRVFLASQQLGKAGWVDKGWREGADLSRGRLRRARVERQEQEASIGTPGTPSRFAGWVEGGVKLKHEVFVFFKKVSPKRGREREETATPCAEDLDVVSVRVFQSLCCLCRFCIALRLGHDAL